MSLPADEQEREKFFKFVAKGDMDAMVYLDTIAQLVGLADDAADEELTFDERQSYIVQIMWLALAALPLNHFHQDYGAHFSPLIMEVLTYWQKSDEWKLRGNLKRQQFGFVRRENIDGLVVAVAGICGGPEHAKVVAEAIMQLCHDTGETFEDWCGEGKP